jgi:hypothetical protein
VLLQRGREPLHSCVPVNMRPDDPSRKIYICIFLLGRASCLAFMTDSNLNFWGLIAVPVGLLICFGVALLVWLREELRAEPEDEPKKPR